MDPSGFLVIHQPQFNPYLGVLAKYFLAERIIHLDCVQFVKGEFQNRNKILLAGHPHWLTVPVLHRSGQTIDEVFIDGRIPWRKKHLATLQQAYRRLPRFEAVFPSLVEVYRYETQKLVEWNVHFLNWLFTQLGVSALGRTASELGKFPEGRDQRLIAICRQIGADQYLAGSNGLWYMKRELWDAAGVSVRFIRYQHPTYDQGFDGFHTYLGALDLMFRYPPEHIREIALSGAELVDWPE